MTKPYAQSPIYNKYCTFIFEIFWVHSSQSCLEPIGLLEISKVFRRESDSYKFKGSVYISYLLLLALSISSLVQLLSPKGHKIRESQCSLIKWTLAWFPKDIHEYKILNQFSNCNTILHTPAWGSYACMSEQVIM